MTQLVEINVDHDQRSKITLQEVQQTNHPTTQEHIEKAKECRRAEEKDLEKQLKNDTEVERNRYRLSKTLNNKMIQEEEEEHLKHEITQMIYQKGLRREKRSQDYQNQQLRTMYDRERTKLNETIEEK